MHIISISHRRTHFPEVMNWCFKTLENNILTFKMYEVLDQQQANRIRELSPQAVYKDTMIYIQAYPKGLCNVHLTLQNVGYQ